MSNGGGSVDSREERLHTLVATRGGALLTYAFLLCNDESDAADLVQDALVIVFSRRGPEGGEISNLEAYVKKTVLNAYIDSCRRAARWQRLRNLINWSESGTTEAEDTILVDDELARAMSSLSPMQRVVFSLRYYEELSIEQIGLRLDCSPGTVKRHLSDARTRLARAYNTTKGLNSHG